MRPTLRDHGAPSETYETKSELRERSRDVPLGEAIGYLPEDHDLSQFGYKAELEVSMSAPSFMGLTLTIPSGALVCGP